MYTVGIDTHSRTHAVCVLDDDGKRMKEFTVKGGIADLAGAPAIAAEHVAEAIQYRRLDASF